MTSRLRIWPIGPPCQIGCPSFLDVGWPEYCPKRSDPDHPARVCRWRQGNKLCCGSNARDKGIGKSGSLLLVGRVVAMRDKAQFRCAPANARFRRRYSEMPSSPYGFVLQLESDLKLPLCISSFFSGQN